MKKKSLLKRIKPFRLVLKLFLVFALVLSLVLIYFRFNPIPTSAFIFNQNRLAANNPNTNKPAQYQWVDLKNISPHLILAAISSEDQRFPDHYGFDTIQIQAAIKAYQNGKKLRGASSITQQLAKNLFLWNGRSATRKVLEAMIVPFIELWWSKERIIEVYLNVIQFGPVTYGVHQASLQNFHKLPRAISASQAAWLIAVLPSPSKSKIKKPSARLVKHHNWILKQMKVLKALGLLKKL